MKLLSDSSSIQLQDLPTNAQPDAVIELLSSFGFTVLESAINIKPMARSGSQAVVKFDDPDSAKLVVRKFHETFGDDGGELSVKVIQRVAKFGSRLTLNSVSCSWLRPARMARLFYEEFDEAVAAKKILESKPGILGRKFTIVGPVPGELVPNLHLTGLHPATEKIHFEDILDPDLRPVAFVMRKPISVLSDEETAEIIEDLLRDVGPLEYFGIRGPSSYTKRIRATATFIDRDSAIRAVDRLNDTKVRQFGGSRILVSRRISIKYFVSSQIARAIQTQLDSLKTYKVLIEVFISAGRPFSAIRVSGETEKPVADVKVLVEKLIAGDIVMDGESALWDSWFSKHDAIEYLKELSIEKKVYIYRDDRKSQLRIYGGSSTSKSAIERRLIAAMEFAKKVTYSITLDRDMLLKTTHGGLRRLREKFGKSVTLSYSGSSPAIVLSCSAKEIETAHALILGDSSIKHEPEADDCAICWCAAVEPLQLSCGHAYCRDCFFKAADAAVDHLPFACFGDQGRCSHVFGIRELRNVLPYAKFEKLLEDAFDTYIRTRPLEFQYCPTADCLSIYRPTDDGSIFTCPSCLSSICTTCNVHEHDGITCADWKENYSDGGIRALQKYKAEHDVRDCPKCQAAIEKDAGCMHMQCGNCKAHLCWFCMEFFERGAGNGSEECYAHMSGVHGGIYDPGDPTYAADSDTSDDEGDGWEDEDGSGDESE